MKSERGSDCQQVEQSPLSPQILSCHLAVVVCAIHADYCMSIPTGTAVFKSIGTTTNLAEGRREEMLIRISVFVCVNVETVRGAVSLGSSNFANLYCANDIGTHLVSTRTCFLWYVSLHSLLRLPVLPNQLCRLKMAPKAEWQAPRAKPKPHVGGYSRGEGGWRDNPLPMERVFGARDDGLSRCVADVPRRSRKGAQPQGKR